MNHKKIPITDIIKNSTEQLKKHFDFPEQHAWWILESITNKKKANLIAHETITLTSDQQQKLDSWIDQLINKNIPLQYLIGSVPFIDLEILVETPTLIPRPETEEWCVNLIEQLNKLSHKKLTVLDLCSGSGCITLALAQAFPAAHVYGLDISDKAIALAQKNAIHNRISNATFLHSDLFIFFINSHMSGKPAFSGKAETRRQLKR